MDKQQKEISKKQIEILRYDSLMHKKLLIIAEIQMLYEKLLMTLLMAESFKNNMILESSRIMKKIAKSLMYNSKFWEPDNITELQKYKNKINVIPIEELKICLVYLKRFIRKYQ